MTRPMAELLILCVGLTGCFNPEVQDGGFLCEANGICPAGFSCVSAGGGKVCRLGAASGADAGIDGPRVDGPEPDGLKVQSIFSKDVVRAHSVDLVMGSATASRACRAQIRSG